MSFLFCRVSYHATTVSGSCVPTLNDQLAVFDAVILVDMWRRIGDSLRWRGANRRGQSCSRDRISGDSAIKGSNDMEQVVFQ